ncbi:MAG: hypothetical protein ACYCOR_17325 [Acidobacteriaceae bacterium]
MVERGNTPMRPNCATILAICLLSVGWALASQSKLPDNKNPVWTEEILRDIGSSPVLLDSNRAGLSFLDDESLLVYEVNQTGQLASRESPEIASAFRLHVSLVDVRSGRLILSREWGTRLHSTAIQVTTGGVLVKTGGIVKLYSPDFAQARDLPFALDPNGSYFTSVSASGKTIVISHYFQKEHNYISHLDVLDANTLKIRRSWDQDPPIFHFSMSDERFATAHDGVVAMTKFERAGRSTVVTVLGALKQGCAAGGVGPSVVSDELIVLRDCKEVLLLTVAGVAHSLDAFNGRGSTAVPGNRCKPYNAGISGKVAVASGGARFVALTLPVLKIKKPLLAEWRTCLDGLKIAVYDLTLKRRILVVDIDPLPKNDYDFAMSPDGSKLAVLNDRDVSIYSVPVQSVERDVLR